MAYAAGYLVAGTYRDNPMEVMAYDLQNQFDAGGRIQDVEGAIRHQCDALVAAILNHAFEAWVGARLIRRQYKRLAAST